jgi:hypothetical protein
MENHQLSNLVRVLQIISAAMIMGIVAVAITSLLIVNWDQVNTELLPLGLIALIGPLVSCGAAFVLPGIVFKQSAAQYANANPKPELQSLLRASGQAATTSSIVGLALAEGGALLALVIWMVSGNLLGLIGAFVGLALLVLKFPTAGKVEQRFADFREEVKLRQRSV